MPVVFKVRIVSHDDTDKFIELDVPAFKGLLGHCESLTLVSLTEQSTADIEWNLVCVPGIDRDNEGTAFKIGPEANILANGLVRHTKYDTITSFLPDGRLRILFKNTSMVTTTQSALITGVLYALTIGQ